MKTLAFLIVLLISTVLFAQKTEIKLELPSLISDNMVLQQKSEITLWGKAAPMQEVKISTSWKANGNAVTDNNGNWLIKLKTPVAGGPYTIDISTKGSKVSIKNVMIGEVWFCSGQSNMEMSMTGWPPTDTIAGSAREIASANNPNIRFFIVQRAISIKPEENVKGKWDVCSPATVAPSSATAYFFAKKLYEHIKVPIGLIESAWGGTPAESWISPGALLEAGEFVNVLENIQKSQPLYQEYMKWIKQHPVVDLNEIPEKEKFKNLDLKDITCSLADYNDSNWPKMNLPKLFEQSSIGEFDGVVWLRKTINIPAGMTGKDLVLSLGPIDDMDCTWFNGQKVGATDESGFWKLDRIYTIPSSMVKEGNNTIAIRVIDTQGGGGVYGKDDQLYIGIKDNAGSERISLKGEWAYMPVAEWIENKFYVFNTESMEFFSQVRPVPVNAYTASVLNNAMVHPVINYYIKGAIWYQGEANVGRALQYQKIFPLLINDWRKAWNIGDFPFYFVQIAPWIYEGLDGSSSAELRDAQRLSLKVPNTGMAVTLDIGNNFNIHPANKTDVGNRLAFWALAKNYDVKIPYSGPLYKTMKRDGEKLILQFDYTNGGLVAKNSKLKEFEIAGKDGKFVPAEAQILNNEVVVWANGIEEPEKVRYCWRNGSEASLFNGAGLPASGFESSNITDL